MSGKAKKILTGSFLGTIEFFSSAIIGLMMMPFIIHSLGDRMYGLWIFVGSFLGYYGLMDFGLNSAVQRFVSRAVGAGDYEEENKVINTSLAIFSVIGLTALLISFGVAYFVPFMVKNISEVATFRIVILILGINFACGFPLRVFSGILSANVRYDISVSIELSKLFIRTGLIILALKSGYGIIVLALITAAVDLTAFVARYIMVRSKYPHVQIGRRYIDRTKIRELFGYSGYTFISQVADQLRFNVDSLVITTFLSLTMVTPFSIGSRLVKYYMDFITATTGMLTPVFSQYDAAKQNDLLREKFLFVTKITSYLAILIGGMLIIVGKAFIIRWVGLTYSSSYGILVVLIVPMILAMMQTPSVQMMYGISKHKFFAYVSIIEGVVNLILSIVLVKHYGIIGVALGTAVPMVITKIFVQPFFVCRAIQLSPVTYYMNTLLPILLKSCSLLFLLWALMRRFITPDYMALAGISLSMISIYAVIVVFSGFTRVEREYVRSIVWPMKHK